MPRKKVTFGAQPKVQPPNINEWVETREVISPPEAAQSEPAVQSEPSQPPSELGAAAAAAPPAQEKIKRLTLDIPESLHRRIKGRAVMEGTTMVEMLRELLLETYQ